VTDSQDWKQKYLSALDEIEAKERAWGEEESVLRLAVSRLTLAADPSDPTLARELEAIREAVRGELRLQDLGIRLERLGEIIRRLDQARAQRHKEREPYEVLLEVLERLQVPRGLRRKAKALKARVSRTQSEGEIPARIDELAGLIREIIDWMAAEAPPAQPEEASLLGRLLGGGSKAAPESGSSRVVDAPETEAARAAARTIADWLESHAEQGEAGNPALERAAEEGRLRRVVEIGLRQASRLSQPSTATRESDVEPPDLVARRVLETLVDAIPLPGELDERAGELRARIAKGPVEELDELVTNLAGLVTDAQRRIQAEKAALEGFLQQLTERLRELDGQLLANEASRKEAQRRRSDVTDRLDAEVRTMGGSVREARDLETLKAGIQERLDTIQRHIDDGREIEAERERQAEDEIRQLTSRLESLEQETTELRDRVQEERSLALRDPLTGLPNRLAFDERIGQEFARWKRYGRPLVVSIWDIDRFKRINDNYGHKAGDRVLRILAELLSEQVRETDFMARYGGEEFVLLMPETGLDGAQSVAEKLRLAVQECDTHFHGQPVELTVSCGLTLLSEGDTAESALERADQALYRAKRAGRNRCITI
jgi:diguanylate cyclase